MKHVLFLMNDEAQRKYQQHIKLFQNALMRLALAWDTEVKSNVCVKELLQYKPDTMLFHSEPNFHNARPGDSAC